MIEKEEKKINKNNYKEYYVIWAGEYILRIFLIAGLSNFKSDADFLWCKKGDSLTCPFFFFEVIAIFLIAMTISVLGFYLKYS